MTTAFTSNPTKITRSTARIFRNDTMGRNVIDLRQVLSIGAGASKAGRKRG